MLSRCGNKVYWMGRYLERTEYLAHYMKAHYTYLMELPVHHQREATLESVLQVANAYESYFSAHSQPETEDVLTYISVGNSNQNSLLAYISKLRECASGVRDILSTELWEYINCFYHTMRTYTSANINQEGFQNFTQKIESGSYIIKGYIHDNIIRTDTWTLLSLGICLERAQLISQTLLYQIKATAGHDKPDQAGLDESLRFALLLQSIGAYGMFKQEYQKNANRSDTLHFLIANKEFPKSLAYNFNSIHSALKSLCCLRQEDQQTLESVPHAIRAQCQTFNPGEETESIINFLEGTLSNINKLSGQLEQLYLKP